MKSYYILLLLTVLPSACSQNHDIKIRKQVTAVAEEYILNQLSKPEKTISDNGLVTISDDQKKYIIEPAKIFTGFIDDDQETDAIVSLATFQGQFQTASEQLIILKSETGFKLASAIESDMRIISIKERIITADVPEHSRSTPLFNCPSCWEVVKYQFKSGELVRTE
jgi:hypothetical protein